MVAPWYLYWSVEKEELGRSLPRKKNKLSDVKCETFNVQCEMKNAKWEMIDGPGNS